jgi:cytochrome c6
MAQATPDRHVMFSSLFLMMSFAGLMLFVFSIARANLGPGSAASAATFQRKCAICHGPDGRGSAVGNSMKFPDLRSLAVQKVPDVELAQIIANGKGGMPAFKSSLTEDQIRGLVTYIHSQHHPVVMLRGREGTL